MQIDLDAIITSLNNRFNELNNFTFVEPDPIEENRKTLQLHKMLTNLNEEITKYERIRANSTAATITIEPVSDRERQELQDALSSLNTAIRQDEVWHRAISLGTAVLEAAAKIRSKTSASPQLAPAVAAMGDPVADILAPAKRRIDRLLARHAKPRAGRAKAKGGKGRKKR